MIRVFRLGRDERAAWMRPIVGLEGMARYPLGQDHFRIDHGRDYFRFFDRLGDLAYYVAADDGELVAVGCGMLRDLPGFGAAWYVGDLKVRPARRGEHVPLRMMGAAVPVEYPRCGRGYGISMNPPTGENRVLRLVRRFAMLPVEHACTLEMYSLDAAEARAARPTLEALLGPVSFLSLRGVKDILLESTGAPLPLLHVQHGPLAERGPGADLHAEPLDGAVHMLCAPAGDPLTAALRERGHTPTATATVIAHRMDGYPWRNVLTSEI